MKIQNESFYAPYITPTLQTSLQLCQVLTKVLFRWHFYIRFHKTVVRPFCQIVHAMHFYTKAFAKVI